MGEAPSSFWGGSLPPLGRLSPASPFKRESSLLGGSFLPGVAFLGEPPSFPRPLCMSSRDVYVFSNSYSNFWLIFGKLLRGSFSAVSKPNFASKYSLESSGRDVQDLDALAPLSIQNFSQILLDCYAFS